MAPLSRRGKTAYECLIGTAEPVNFPSIIPARLQPLPPESQQVLVIPHADVLNSSLHPRSCYLHQKKKNASGTVSGRINGKQEQSEDNYCGFLLFFFFFFFLRHVARLVGGTSRRKNLWSLCVKSLVTRLQKPEHLPAVCESLNHRQCVMLCAAHGLEGLQRRRDERLSQSHNAVSISLPGHSIISAMGKLSACYFKT